MSIGTAPSAPNRRLTLADLMKTDGQAELIGGRIVRQMAAGYLPGGVSARILLSLDDHAEATGHGLAFTSTLGYAVAELPSGRESFSPDASYYVGPLPDNPMGFIEGPPTFAVEVRSENDYGTAAEVEMADKRADYFQAGTLVVWDVDPIAETVRKYLPASPDQPTQFNRGDQADGEPAVPGWRIAVDRIFS